ncbi:MAG: ATP-binding protein [bacterium]
MTEEKKVHSFVRTNETLSLLENRIREIEEERDGLEEILEANLILNYTLRLKDLITLILASARSVMRCETASLILYNENTDLLEFEVSLDEPGQKLLKITLPMGEGIAGTVAQTLEPYISNDVQGDPHFAARFDKLSGFKTRSLLCVPLQAREKMVGVMELINKEKGDFTPLDLRKSMALANLVAVAIENSRLYQEAEEMGNLREMSRFKSDLMALVAHELRNPMTTIKAYSEMMLIQKNLPRGEQEEYLGTISGEISRLNRLIDSFLAVSQLESGKISLNIETFSVCEIIRQRTKAMEPVSSIHRFEANLPGEDLLVKADRDKTIQILDNLLGNALKYSPQGGRVSVQARRESGRVVISVSDEGIGIPPEHQGKIFQHFYRVGSREVKGVKGTGLGLTITKLLVERQGGTIWFESESGRGTTFFFTMPEPRENTPNS